MGCRVKEVPISWINRTPDMGTSSFRLVKIGGGYWSVLWNLWRKCGTGAGPYKGLPKHGSIRKTFRDEEPLPSVASTGARDDVHGSMDGRRVSVRHPVALAPPAARPATWMVGAILVIAFGVRVWVAQRSGLWVDEAFSLALATGHSLEHPASQAEPEWGDYVEGASLRRAGEFAAYLKHDDPPAGLARLFRGETIGHQSAAVLHGAVGMDPCLRHQRSVAAHVVNAVLAGMCSAHVFHRPADRRLARPGLEFFYGRYLRFRYTTPPKGGCTR